MSIFIYMNTGIFCLLALLHFYWALGGKLAFMAAIPSTQEGKLLFRPGTWATLTVAFGLLLFAFISLSTSNLFEDFITLSWIKYGNVGIGFLFLLRAIGDFNYVGFFKKVKNTAFAKKDSLIYSPLCLLISLMAFIIALQI